MKKIQSLTGYLHTYSLACFQFKIRSNYLYHFHILNLYRAALHAEATRSLGVRRFFDFFPQNFEDSDIFEDFLIFTISYMLNLKRFFEIFCDFF